MMSDLFTLIVLPLIFMLIPVWIPVIGVTVGAVLDLVRRDPAETTAAVVLEAKRRTATSRSVTGQAQAA